MPQLLRSRRSYDHRIREIVCQTGNPRIFHHLRIPRSTTASWLSRGCRSVVSLGWQHDMASVLEENERLKRRAERQTAIIRLLVVLLKLSGFRLDEQRLPDGKAKAGVLRAIDRTKDVFPLKSALRLVRLSPARYEKPKTGIRATHPNEYWHIDVTVIRLLDDTKCYLHAVIDNFSRRILSWRLTKRLAPTTTCEILKEAAKDLGLTPTVVADSGVDNVNARVDQLMADGIVHRVLAQVEVSFSNSMIEAFWRSLRHQWL